MASTTPKSPVSPDAESSNGGHRRKSTLGSIATPVARYMTEHVPDKVKDFVSEKKCPPFVAANVTLFTFDFIITVANFMVAIFPAMWAYKNDINTDDGSPDRCYTYCDTWDGETCT